MRLLSRETRLAGALLLLVEGLLLAAPALAVPSKQFDLTHVDGKVEQTFRGPVELVFFNLNRLKYDIQIGETVTSTDGPDLTKIGGFFPQLQATPAADANAGQKKATQAEPAPKRLSLEDLDAAFKDAALFGLDSAAVMGRFSALQLRASRGQLELDREPELKRMLDEIETKRRESLQAFDEALATAASELERAKQTVAGFEQQAKASQGRVDGGLKAFEALVARSDSTLRVGGARTLKDELRVYGTSASRALGATWPAKGEVEAVLEALKAIRQALAELPRRHDYYATWAMLFAQGEIESNGERQRALEKKIEDVETAAAQYGPGSDGAKGFAQATKTLASTLPLVNELLGKDPNDPQELSAFYAVHPVACGYPVFKNKTTKVEVTRTERFPAKDEKPKTETLVVATVECPSSFSLSWGIGVADLKREKYSVIDARKEVEDGPPTTEKQVAADTVSHPVLSPMSLIHTRLKNWQLDEDNFACALHLTSGVVLDLYDTASNLSLGYLGGVSFSFQERLYVTVGVEFHRIQHLAGGYAVGQVVPDGVNAPPTRETWDHAAAIAVTYRPRPSD